MSIDTNTGQLKESRLNKPITTFTELVKILDQLIPRAQIETDNGGQVIIYTGMMENEGVLLPYEEDEDTDDR